MKLTDVVVAVNENKLYTDFIPIFVKAWKSLFPNITLHIIYIAHNIPHHLIKYKEHIQLFHPMDGVSDVFIAQFIRILYPCICNAEGGILTTDIDMIPMNTHYYTKHIDEIEDNRFILYRHPFFWAGHQQMPICYSIAHSKTWREIFNINSINDIKDTLLNEYNKIEYTGQPDESGWYTDQIYLYNKVTSWMQTKRTHAIILGDDLTDFKRLDRIFKIEKSETLEKEIRDGVYSDFHMYRPYRKFKDINDWVCNKLNQSL